MTPRAVSSGRGFSIVEILIALAVGVIMISGVAIVVFGDESSLTGVNLSAEVERETQVLIDRTESLARDDFNLVNPTTTSDVYQKTITVRLLPDFVSKLVTARIASTLNPLLYTSYTTLITNLENVDAPDTCSSVLSGDWSHPHTNSFTLSSLIGSSGTTSVFSLSDIDAYHGKLYVAADSRSYRTDPTLFVINVPDPGHYSLSTTSDTTGTSVSGLAAVQVAEDRGSGKLYVYAANTGSVTTKGHLQIIDVGNSSVIVYPVAGASSQTGKSVFYHDGYVYLGLTSAVGGSPELHVIQVTNPQSPSEVGFWPAVGTVGIAINDIRVRDGYAYLAHGTTTNYAEHVTILDAHHPAALYRASGFLGVAGSAFANSGNGKSLYLVGSTIYLGRTASNKSGIPEFFVLDGTRPDALVAAPLGSATLIPDASIVGVIARDYLAFLAAGNALKILKIDNPSHMSEYASSSLPGTATSMDCEGNVLYVGSNDASGNGSISIITPG